MLHTQGLYYTHTGPWQEVVSLGPCTMRNLGDTDVLIHPLYTPINPSDLNMIAGTYVYQPEPPVVLGREGVGRVVAVGAAVGALKPGDVVISIAPHVAYGFWSDTTIAKSDSLFLLPAGCDLQQAAMLSINPLTALALLRFWKTGWIIQNAANSGVGIAIGQLAMKMGISMCHLVRHESAMSQLLDLGFSHVYLDTDDVVARLKTYDCGLAFNAVGGESAGRLLKSLRPKGMLMTYGAMGRAPVSVSNGALIYKQITVGGFLRSQWVIDVGQDIVLAAYATLIDALSTGALHLPVQAVFPFEAYREALSMAEMSGRRGKVLFSGA